MGESPCTVSSAATTDALAFVARDVYQRLVNDECLDDADINAAIDAARRGDSVSMHRIVADAHYRHASFKIACDEMLAALERQDFDEMTRFSNIVQTQRVAMGRV